MPALSPRAAGAAPSLLAAGLTLLFLVSATVPYVWLITHFGYDDILREPTAVILRSVHAGGAPLVWAWLLMIALALLVTLLRGGGQAAPGVTACAS